MNVHPYNDNSDIYNFFFHPKHQNELTTISIITNIAISVFSFGVWQIVFWSVNLIDNFSLDEKWKVHKENLPKNSEDIKCVASDKLTEGSRDLIERIFPKEVKSGKIKVDIPKLVKKSLDQIFGIGNVVDRMPAFDKIIDDSFSIDDMKYPVMKGIDKFGAPEVLIKLVAANPKKYMEDHFSEQIPESVEYLNQMEVTQQDKQESSLASKERRVKKLAGEPHILALGQRYFDGSSLQWCARELVNKKKSPAFFHDEDEFYIGPLTSGEDGKILNTLEGKIPEFQKLFSEEGEGTDIYGNQWKLFL